MASKHNKLRNEKKCYRITFEVETDDTGEALFFADIFLKELRKTISFTQANLISISQCREEDRLEELKRFFIPGTSRAAAQGELF